MDKVKIAFDQHRYDSNRKKIIELSENKLPELKNEVSTKFGIDLTAEIFQDIISNAGNVIEKQIEKDYKADHKAVKLVAAKDVLTSQFEETKKALNSIVSKYAELGVLLKYGKIDDSGHYLFDDGYDNLLREENTKYLTDSAEINLYRQKQIALKEFEKFKSLIKVSRIASIPVQAFAAMVIADEQTDFSTLAHGAIKSN